MADREASTGDLLKRLYNAVDIGDYLAGSVYEAPSFPEYIRELCKRMGEAPQHIIRRSGIERTYGHQIFNGTRKPSREKIIQLAIGFSLNVEDTQKLLKIARKSELYPRIKRDAVLMYCITHGKGYAEIQKALKLYELPLLGENAF